MTESSNAQKEVKNNINYIVIRRLMQTEVPTSMMELMENATLLAYWLGLIDAICISWELGIPKIPAEQGMVRMLYATKPPSRIAMVNPQPLQYIVTIFPDSTYDIKDATKRVIVARN